jgi:peptidoglycan/LPS O-acetylase OafA/YrhL
VLREGVVIKDEISQNSETSDTDAPARRRTKRKKQLPCSQKLMRSFSVHHTLNRLFQRRTEDDDSNLEVLNGVRVLTLALIILGNTYFFILKGPLQNLEVIEEWMSDSLFTIVIAAELAVDIFFWLSSFLACYFLLMRMNDNEGNLGSVMKIILNRVVRLLPLYIFALLFYWKLIVIYGGEGPMFFMYDTNNECSSYWMWHFLFINNFIPWSSHDNCMNWTWYLANDMQFFLLVPILVTLYYRKRHVFWYTIAGLSAVSIIIQMIVILTN